MRNCIEIIKLYFFFRILDIAKKYPPSIRLVVLETNLTKLKIGELFIITYKGGTLGREGSHEVIIPDINVSKVQNVTLFLFFILKPFKF